MHCDDATVCIYIIYHMRARVCVCVCVLQVVYPASPMLLYTNPALLRLLLIPVLNFANNGTDDGSNNFTNPFSPHQIGPCENPNKPHLATKNLLEDTDGLRAPP